ncbi:hypothetical protein GCM10010193_00470 [Kitasatospora atroaurantiaca]
MAALGRAGVRGVAPGEMPLYTQLSEEYFARGVRLDRADRDPLLGFGLDAAVVLLTPVVLEACHQLWAALSAKAAEKAAEGAKDLLHRIRLRLGRGEGREPAAPVEFTAEELALVRAEAARCAADLDLTEGQQRLLADAIVGALAAPAPAAAPGE